MTVYVDDMAAPFLRMIMCHMAADTSDELLEMADKIGLDRRWIQRPGTIYEHFDVAKGKRAEAVKLGAVEVSRKELVLWMKKKRPAWKGA